LPCSVTFSQSVVDQLGFPVEYLPSYDRPTVGNDWRWTRRSRDRLRTIVGELRPRVVVFEGLNARNLNPEQFTVRFDLASIDVSFISLTKILPALRACLKESADCIALIKPQFEVGKGEVGRGGIVTDPEKHKRVLNEIKQAAIEIGFHPVGVIECPILGAEGNREFLMHLRAHTVSDSRVKPN